MEMDIDEMEMDIDGLPAAAFNFGLQMFQGSLELPNTAAFMFSREGTKILIFKAGFICICPSHNSKLYIEGFSKKRGWLGEFSTMPGGALTEEVFAEYVLNAAHTADIIIFPLWVAHGHRCDINLNPNLEYNGDHICALIYWKQTSEFKVIDCRNVILPPGDLSDKAFTLIFKRVAPSIKTFLGLAGNVTSVKFTHHFPFTNGCGLSVLWHVFKILENPTWRPTADFSADDGTLFVFSAIFVESLRSSGFVLNHQMDPKVNFDGAIKDVMKAKEYDNQHFLDVSAEDYADFYAKFRESLGKAVQLNIGKENYKNDRRYVELVLKSIEFIPDLMQRLGALCSLLKGGISDVFSPMYVKLADFIMKPK